MISSGSVSDDLLVGLKDFVAEVDEVVVELETTEVHHFPLFQAMEQHIRSTREELAEKIEVAKAFAEYERVIVVLGDANSEPRNVCCALLGCQDSLSARVQDLPQGDFVLFLPQDDVERDESLHMVSDDSSRSANTRNSSWCAFDENSERIQSVSNPLHRYWKLSFNPNRGENYGLAHELARTRTGLLSIRGDENICIPRFFFGRPIHAALICLQLGDESLNTARRWSQSLRTLDGSVVVVAMSDIEQLHPPDLFLCTLRKWFQNMQISIPFLSVTAPLPILSGYPKNVQEVDEAYHRILGKEWGYAAVAKILTGDIERCRTSVRSQDFHTHRSLYAILSVILMDTKRQRELFEIQFQKNSAVNVFEEWRANMVQDYLSTYDLARESCVIDVCRRIPSILADVPCKKHFDKQLNNSLRECSEAIVETVEYHLGDGLRRSLDRLFSNGPLNDPYLEDLCDERSLRNLLRNVKDILEDRSGSAVDIDVDSLVVKPKSSSSAVISKVKTFLESITMLISMGWPILVCGGISASAFGLAFALTISWAADMIPVFLVFSLITVGIAGAFLTWKLFRFCFDKFDLMKRLKVKDSKEELLRKNTCEALESRFRELISTALPMDTTVLTQQLESAVDRHVGKSWTLRDRSSKHYLRSLRHLEHLLEDSIKRIRSDTPIF